MKKLSEQALRGEKGIAIVQDLVSNMGFVWRSTTIHDTGIDGTIEIRDQATGRVSGRIIQVQVKATERERVVHSFDRFTFSCSTNDVEYWLGANTPVLLIVCDTQTGKAWWQEVKATVAAKPKIRQNGLFEFHKSKDELTVDCRDKLDLLVSSPQSPYIGPVVKKEQLYSNLLEVSQLPEDLYIAPLLPSAPAKLRWTTGERVASDWLRFEGNVYSVRPLEPRVWNLYCDLGAEERHSSAMIFASQEAEHLTVAKWLLGRCLSEMIGHSVRTFTVSNERVLAFKKPKNGDSRVEKYLGVEKNTERDVVSRQTRANGEVMYRHFGFVARFERIQHRWFLVIQPTYVFTTDGSEISRSSSNWTSGKKALEHNESVRGNVIFWWRYLTKPPSLLFASYRYLGFGRLVSLSAEFGINDSSWIPTKEDEVAQVNRDWTENEEESSWRLI